MHIQEKIDRIKEILLWIYLTALCAGTVYAICTGQGTKNPGEILREGQQKESQVEDDHSILISTYF